VNTRAGDSVINALEWTDGYVIMLDQRLLPGQEQYVSCKTSSAVADAIRNMVIRGAPAIGIAAAYGVVLAAGEAYQDYGQDWRSGIRTALDNLEGTRPTAINLHWAIRRMSSQFNGISGDPVPGLLKEACKIHEEDRTANHLMGDTGAEIIKDSKGVLTHCNAGALATGGYGTALGVIRSAHGRIKPVDIYACETRPWLQGARLTIWELAQDNIPATLITDSSAAALMQTGKIDWVIVGADRIAANGDTANKIGTYSLAVAARFNGLKFMVVAPTSTIDPVISSGADIPIEERSAAEFYDYASKLITPAGTRIYNPVFDVTPAELIDVLVTEKGPIYQPDREKIGTVLTSK